MGIYTDGSVLHSSKSSTAAVYIPDLNVSHARKLSFHATSTTAELVALELDALEKLPYCGKALLLTDSQKALQHLANLDDAPQYARKIAHLARNLQAKDWAISFQWLPSHTTPTRPFEATTCKRLRTTPASHRLCLYCICHPPN
ncbi:hypothetical protein HPB47_002116 [Ixodes persulcatus]|uniref:Uncharacterized protein n=1 Tax=Ixodes persulcatus TaxID=34615 RepID=A0AC60PMB9_IXOPE|nr:hypothetical protein HPB47_002116 [Ixodes persulcatus]